MKPVNSYVQVPVELLSYVQEHKLVKTFTVFLYLKCMAVGKVRNTDEAFKQMPCMLGIKDRRTMHKHIQRLLGLNWIGFNEATGDYFIRGTEFIWKQHCFKIKTAATFYFKHIRKVQAFIAGSIISHNVKQQQYFREVVQTGKVKPAITKRHVAKQGRPQPAKTTDRKAAYYGLGVHRIATLLFCCPSRACKLKHDAEKAGFIKTKKRYNELGVLPVADYWYRDAYKRAYPENGKALRFRSAVRNNRRVVLVLEQLHDEVRPLVPFKRVKKLRLSRPTLTGDEKQVEAKVRLRVLQGE